MTIWKTTLEPPKNVKTLRHLAVRHPLISLNTGSAAEGNVLGLWRGVVGIEKILALL